MTVVEPPFEIGSESHPVPSTESPAMTAWQPCDTCDGVRVQGRHCLAHLTDSEWADEVEHLRDGGRLDARGVAISGELSISLRNALGVAKGKIWLPGSAVSAVQAPSGIDLADARFLSDVDFRDAKFCEQTSFNGVQFCGDADFRGVTFSENASFEGVQFSGLADFDGARFSGLADFSSGQFSSGAIFANTRFSDVANFTEAQFVRRVMFQDATFTRQAGFLRHSSPVQRGFATRSFLAKRILWLRSSPTTPASRDYVFRGRRLHRGAVFGPCLLFESALLGHRQIR